VRPIVIGALLLVLVACDDGRKVAQPDQKRGVDREAERVSAALAKASKYDLVCPYESLGGGTHPVGLSALSGRRNTVDAQRGRLTTRNSLLMPCAFQ